MKKILTKVIIVIVIIMLIPIPRKLKDGGSIEYNAILYQVTKVHRLSEKTKTGYEDGWIIKLFGIEIYSKVDVEIEASNKEEFKETEVEGISMALKENTLTKTGATIIIKESNVKGTHVYGQEFELQAKENDKWIEVKRTEKVCAFNEMAYHANNEGILEMKQNWECMYGSLEKGTYKLVKDTFLTKNTPITESDKQYISIEFTIE